MKTETWEGEGTESRKTKRETRSVEEGKTRVGREAQSKERRKKLSFLSLSLRLSAVFPTKRKNAENPMPLSAGEPRANVLLRESHTRAGAA